MNEVLVRVVIDCALFFELSGEKDINPDVAVQQLEQIAATLQQLPRAEQTQLMRHMAALAQKEERERGRGRRWQCLNDLSESLGLSSE